MTRTTVFAGLFVLAGCSATDVATSVEPVVNEVSFSPGCSTKTGAPTDCSFGFVMTYASSYADVETAVSHVTDNAQHTVEITVDAWSSSHVPAEAQPRDADLGLLDVMVGQTYAVTVVDRKHTVLWSGKVDTVYHL